MHLVQAAESHERSDVEPNTRVSQDKAVWTQFHLSTAHQKGACAHFSLHGHWLMSSHCIIVSLLDGWVACPAPEPSLKCQWRCSSKDFAWRPGLYKACHLTAIKRRPKQSEPQKSCFFPPQRVPHKASFVLHSRGILSRGTLCLFLQFLSLTLATFHFYIGKAEMSHCCKQSFIWLFDLLTYCVFIFLNYFVILSQGN